MQAGSPGPRTLPAGEKAHDLQQRRMDILRTRALAGPCATEDDGGQSTALHSPVPQQ